MSDQPGIILQKDLKVNISPELGEIEYATDTAEIAVNSMGQTKFRVSGKIIYGVLKGNITPSNSLGIQGDFYIKGNSISEYFKFSDQWVERIEGKSESYYDSLWEKKLDYPLNAVFRDGSVPLDANYDLIETGVVSKGYIDDIVTNLEQNQNKFVTTDGSNPMEVGYEPVVGGDVVNKKSFEDGKVLLVPPITEPSEIGVLWNDNGIPRIVDSVFDGEFLAPSTGAEDRLGMSIATDGVHIIAGTSIQRAYIFNMDGSYVSEIISPVDAHDFSQYSVDIYGDLAIVSAPFSVNKVFIFNVTDGAFLFELAPTHATAFGSGVAISANRIVVGQLNSQNYSSSGWLHIYDINGTPIATKITPSFWHGYSEFGKSVSIHDGLIVVGAPAADSSQAGEGSGGGGAGYVYTDSGNFVKKLYGAGGQAGYSVDIHNSTVILGTRSPDCYVYDISSGTPKYILESDPNIPNAHFGTFGVALSDKWILVGRSNGGTGASIFNSSGEFSESLDGPLYFGERVATSGQYLVLSHWYADTHQGSHSGAIYIYRRL